jgi:hypothetical protein
VAKGKPTVSQKRKTQNVAEITLPYLLDAVVSMEDMLGKVPKLRYLDHDVCDTKKFPYLVEEAYLANTWEIGPLGKPIMEPTQWITWLYNFGIMNLLKIPHFGRCKNVGLCIKKFLAPVHGGIL